MRDAEAVLATPCGRTELRASALPAQIVRMVACAVRGPSPANRSAPQTSVGEVSEGAVEAPSDE